MPKNTKLRLGSRDSGHLPDIIELRHGSTETSGNMTKNTELKGGNTETLQATSITSHSSKVEAQRG